MFVGLISPVRKLPLIRLVTQSEQMIDKQGKIVQRGFKDTVMLKMKVLKETLIRGSHFL